MAAQRCTITNQIHFAMQCYFINPSHFHYKGIVRYHLFSKVFTICIDSFIPAFHNILCFCSFFMRIRISQYVSPSAINVHFACFCNVAAFVLHVQNQISFHFLNFILYQNFGFGLPFFFGSRS